MKKTILIAGGTGRFGRPVAEKLLKEGYTIRILSRNVERAREKMGHSFEFVQGDVRIPEKMIEATRGCFGLHINLNSNTHKQLEETELRGAMNCISAAKSNQLERITLISCAYVKRENLWSKPIRNKWRIEELVRNSGIPYTIFAPTHFMNSLTGYIKGDRAIIIGNQKRKVRWLSVTDYAQLVSRAYASQKAVNKKFLIFGPEACTLEEALTKYCRKKFPSVSLYKTSLGMFTLMATLSLNRKLMYVAALMKAFSRIEDASDMAETALILGKPATGLEDWMASL